MNDLVAKRKKFFDIVIVKQCEKCGNIPGEFIRNILGYNENTNEMEISCIRCGFTYKVKMEDVDNG